MVMGRGEQSRAKHFFSPRCGLLNHSSVAFSFVWKALPFPPDDPRLIPAIRTYRWTGRTDYLTLTQQTFLAFGGGYDGRFGLWLDERMEKGYSTRCEAFANEPLVDEKAWTKRGGAAADATKPAPSRGGDQDVDEANFEVFGLECWAVGV